MDFDDDGVLDFISGCYDPGDIYLFRGLGGGEYEAGVVLRDRAGIPLVHHPEQRKLADELQADPEADPEETIHARVASFGSWPATVDWDGDGDLDLLIGSFGGRVFLRVNAGTRSEPVFDETCDPIEAGGEPLRVNGHANPAVADWDGDGLWDLVVSAADGSVGWYRNAGDAGHPRLEPRVELVEAKAEGKFLTRRLEPREPIAPGVRAQICVTDYDGDGWVDLILGDLQAIERLRELTPAERAEFEALLAREEEIAARYENASEDEFEAIEAALEEVREERRAYLQGPFPDSPLGPVHSFVWLFLRDASGPPPAARGR